MKYEDHATLTRWILRLYILAGFGLIIAGKCL
jgi:hypothetical protein